MIPSMGVYTSALATAVDTALAVEAVAPPCACSEACRQLDASARAVRARHSVVRPTPTPLVRYNRRTRMTRHGRVAST